jgi:hypothetical protein
MKFVILSHGIVPDFGVRGPVLTPREYDLHQVLKWVAYGVDIREVMDDGTYRKLSFNDERIMDKIRKELNNKVVEKKEEEKKEVEKIPKHRRVGIYPKEEIKEIKHKKVEVNKVEEEKIIEPAKEEINVDDGKVDFPIDNLEKPE